MIYGLRKCSNCDDLRRINFKVICRLQSFSNEMFCSCRICTDKRVAWSLWNSRASCFVSDVRKFLFTHNLRFYRFFIWPTFKKIVKLADADIENYVADGREISTPLFRGGSKRGSPPPSQRSARSVPQPIFCSVIGNLWWKLSDYTLVLCQEMHVWTYDWQKLSGDRPLRKPLACTRDWLPPCKVEMLEPPLSPTLLQ